jgi:hypothetical protein
MSSYLVPHNDESDFSVAQPKPDLLYGYSSDTQNGAFTQSQILTQTTSLSVCLRHAHTSLQTLKYPFLTVQVKAAGGAGTKGGDLWSATNECAGASAACLEATGTLDAILLLAGIHEDVDSLLVSYAIAVDNNVAQLYVAWVEELHALPWVRLYYLQRVDAFLLSRAEDFMGFRMQVRNILDWGKGARLKQIQGFLDALLVKHRKGIAARETSAATF